MAPQILAFSGAKELDNALNLQPLFSYGTIFNVFGTVIVYHYVMVLFWMFFRNNTNSYKYQYEFFCAYTHPYNGLHWESVILFANQQLGRKMFYLCLKCSHRKIYYLGKKKKLPVQDSYISATAHRPGWGLSAQTSDHIMISFSWTKSR